MIRKNNELPDVKSVKELLEQYGLSLAALHRKTHIPYSTLQNWANGVSVAPIWALYLINCKLEAEMRDQAISRPLE